MISFQLAASRLKTKPMERNVSGIIDSTARIVAIEVPKRMPR